MPKKKDVELVLRARNLTKRAFKAVTGDLDTLSKRSKHFKAVGGNIKAVGSQISAVGQQMVVAGAIMTAAIAAPTKVAADYETGLARVATLIDGDLTKTTERYSQAIQDMSVRTNQSLGTLQDGLYDAISAGVDAGDAMQFLDVASMAATGGFTDVKTAVNGLTSVMNSYGLEVKDALKTADQMALAVKIGKTTFGELSTSIGRAASTAANFGVSQGDLLASVATLTKAGVSTDEAVTAVRQLLVSIANPASDAKDALDALQAGVPIADRLQFSISSLQDKGLLNYFQELIRLTGGDAEALNQLIGSNVRAQAAMFGLAQQQAAFVDTAKEMEAAGAQGSLTIRNFETAAESAGFQFGQLGKEVKIMLLALGQAFIPILIDLKNAMMPIIAAVITWVKENRTLVSFIAKMAVGLAGVLVIFGPIVAAVGAIAGAVAAVVAAGPVLLVVGKVLAIIAAVIMGIIAAVSAISTFFGKDKKSKASLETSPFKNAESELTSLHRQEENKRTAATKGAIQQRVKALLNAGKQAKSKASSAISISAEQYEKLKGRFWLGGAELSEILAGAGGAGFASKAIRSASAGPRTTKNEINIDHIELPHITDFAGFVDDAYEFQSKAWTQPVADESDATNIGVTPAGELPGRHPGYLQAAY